MDDKTFAEGFAHELEAESASSRKCLERMDFKLFGWKPHPTSMEMGYLALLVAEIPLWITHIINNDEIDFVTFNHIKAESAGQLVEHFDKNVAEAKIQLLQIKNGDLDGKFDYKGKGELLYSTTKRESIESTINHLVHHRGQLTVYMRMNEIPVPSLYGPSHDERGF